MSPEELFEEADRLEDSGDERGALHVWRELSRMHPDASRLCRHAWLANELGEKNEAERAFQMAIELDAGLAPAYQGLGSMAIDRGGFREAVQFLSKAVQLDSTRSAYCMLGVALNGLGRDEEACESYRKAIEIDPGFEEAYYNLGVLLRSNDPVQAQALLAKALQLDPSYAEAHSELGWVLRRHGSLPEAEYHLRRAIELRPDSAWTHVYLANLLWERRDLSGAVAEYEWAREAAPNRAFPLWSLANLYEDDGDWEKAQALYAQALELEPDDAVGNMNFGRLLLKRGDLAKARVFLERALILDPTYQRAKDLLDSMAPENQGEARRTETAKPDANGADAVHD